MSMKNMIKIIKANQKTVLKLLTLSRSLNNTLYKRIWDVLATLLIWFLSGIELCRSLGMYESNQVNGYVFLFREIQTNIEKYIQGLQKKWCQELTEWFNWQLLWYPILFTYGLKDVINVVNCTWKHFHIYLVKMHNISFKFVFQDWLLQDGRSPYLPP